MISSLQSFNQSSREYVIEGDFSPEYAAQIIRTILYFNQADQPNVQYLRLSVHDGIFSTDGDLTVNVAAMRRRRSVESIFEPIQATGNWHPSSARSLSPLFITLLFSLILHLLFLL